MPSLTIKECEFDAMVARIKADARLSELLVTAQAAILTECFPHATQVTPHLEQTALNVQDMLITAFALFESERWPSRHIGAA